MCILLKLQFANFIINEYQSINQSIYLFAEYYDKTDSVAVAENESETESTETDFTPDEAPSYTDFLIGYPTQSCKFSHLLL